MRKAKQFKEKEQTPLLVTFGDFIALSIIASFIFYPMLKPVIDYNIMKFKQISYRRK